MDKMEKELKNVKSILTDKDNQIKLQMDKERELKWKLKEAEDKASKLENVYLKRIKETKKY